MIQKRLFSIFQNGSKTYFYSSLFFPTDVRKDVFSLYSFVRTADDLVDQVPPLAKEFKDFRKLYASSLKKNSRNDLIIDSFIELSKEKQFEKSWIDAFLDVMESDITKKSYTTFKETEDYMYGSAEVVGLMMARILNLPTDSYQSAQYLGRSMQYINFIRDIKEDLELGRTYFPETELKKYGLRSLSLEETIAKPAEFQKFMHAQIEKHLEWSSLGEKGYTYIPKRYLIPIKTANDLYKWTAQQIAVNPTIVYKKKIKPGIPRILLYLLKNSF